MGYTRHHAILVSSFGYGDWIEQAHREACRWFHWVSPLSPPQLNNVRSFFIPPDGSNEGWEESDEGDRRRDAMIGWLRAQRFTDGSSPLEWAEVLYGDDNGEARVIRHDAEDQATTRDALRSCVKDPPRRPGCAGR